MGALTIIGSIIKILLFLCNLWGERNAELAKKKAEIAKEMVDAFAETDKNKQASRLNDIVGRIRRV